MEILLEVLLELLLQVFGEALAELGIWSLGEPFRTPANPWLAMLGFFLYGCVFGGLSLLAAEHHFLKSEAARIFNLLAAPALLGAASAGISQLREKRGAPALGAHKFAYGYAFALAFALVRYALAT